MKKQTGQHTQQLLWYIFYLRKLIPFVQKSSYIVTSEVTQKSNIATVLPITLSETVSELDPPGLVPAHRYTPSSSTCTSLMVRLRPSVLIWDLDPVTGEPLLVHIRTGRGSPVTEQDSVMALVLSTTVSDDWSADTVGTTVSEKVHHSARLAIIHSFRIQKAYKVVPLTPSSHFRN